MAIRSVKPFSDEQWTKVTKMMKDGPTDESIATVKKALANTSKIRRS